MMKKKITVWKNNLRLWFNFTCRRLGISSYQIHQVKLPEKKLVYIPIPKNACSTIKHALYEIEFNREFDYQQHQKWGYRDIHDYYNKRPDAFTGVNKLKNNGKSIVFTVIRDPVKRLISCFRNRVVDLKNLEKSKLLLKHKGLPIDPDLNTFIMNLREYRKVNKIIEHHSRPQYQFLGNSLTYVDEIIPFDKMEILKKMLREFKPDLQMRKEKSEGTSYGLNDLSPEALEEAISFYRKDYHLLANYFSSEQIQNQYRKR